MISDDTEHTCLMAQLLIEANGDVNRFARLFASRLRWWILALPAGVVKATTRAGIKLWLGAKPASAGVFSAGNGPAMRAAIFDAAIDDVPQMLEFVRASSVSHTVIPKRSSARSRWRLPLDTLAFTNRSMRTCGCPMLSTQWVTTVRS